MQKNVSVVCAITGGIGSGKSSVANIIRDMGYIVLNSDVHAKELMASDKDIKLKLKKEFGNEVFDKNENLNTSFLSSVVFGPNDSHQKALLNLNKIVHPKVIKRLINEVELYERKGEKLIFVESALIFEAGLEDGFDYVILVDTEKENAIKRTIERSGLTKEEIGYRMKSQISSETKKNAADFVIENNGTINDLKRSVEIIIQIVKNTF